MAAELGIGYVSIVPEVSKISPGIAKALNASEAQAKASGGRMGSMLAGGLTAKLGGVGAAVGAAIGGAGVIKSIAAIGMEFDSTMNNMRAVSGATADQLAAVASKARELGTDATLTATSATDAAAAMTELAKGGFSVDQAMQAAKGTLQLAAAAGVEAADAATIQAQALQAFGLGAENAARVSDILAGAANASSAEMTGIAQGMQQAGTVSKQFGLTVDDTATALAMFANAGIQGSDAGTLLKSALLALTDQGKPAQGAIEALGLTVYDAQGKFVGLSSLMGQLQDASKSMTDEQYQAATATLFGSDAMRMAGIAAQQGSEGFDALEKAVTRQGQAAEVAAAQTQGLPGVVERFQNTIEDLGLQIYDALDESVIGGANLAIDALEGIGPAVVGVAELVASGATTMAQTLGPVGTELKNALGGADIQGAVAWTKDAFDQLTSAGIALLPTISNLATAFGQAAGALGVSSWDLFVAALKVAGVVIEGVAGPMEDLSGFLKDHPALVTAALAAWTGFKTVPAIFSKVNGVMGPHIKSLKEMGQGVKDIKAYYSATGREIGTFSAAAQLAATSQSKTLSSMGTAYNNAANSGKKFGSALGVIKAGAAGASSAMGGLVGALGGPWGIALTVATGLVTAFMSAQARADGAQRSFKTATDEAAEAQQRLNDALAGSKAALNAEQREDAAKVAAGAMAEYLAMGEQLDGLFSSLKGMDEYLGPGKQTWGEQNAAANELKASYKELKNTVTDMGLSMDDLGRIVAEGGPEYEKLMSSLRGSGEAGNNAADQLAHAKGEMQKAVQAARDLDPAAQQAAKGIETLADSASSGEEKLQALESVMQAMGLAPKDATRAMMEAAEAVDQVVESVEQMQVPAEQMGAALFDSEGSLSTTNEASRELFEQLESLRKQMQNVAVSGGDVQGVFDTQISPALDVLAEKFGLSSDQVADLQRQFGLLPKEVSTVVNVNAEGVSGDLAKVYAALYPLQEGQTVEIEAVDDQAVATLNELGIKVRELDNGNVEVTATTAEAEDALARVSQMMAELGDTKLSPTVFLNTEELVGSAANAQAILDVLNLENPSPQAQLIIDDLQKGKDIAVGELNYLAAQSPTPVADLNKDLLQAGVDTSKLSLQQLNDQKTKPVIDANPEPARSNIQKVKDWLASIRDKVVTISTTGGGGSSKFANGGLVQAFAAGGTVGTAAGYRLPTSGRGTAEVDGFQGVDAQGRPTARVDSGEWVINRRSSKKHNRLLSMVNQDSPVLGKVYESMQALAEGGVVDSITSIVKQKFPEMTITSTVRNTNDYHGQGKAVDFSNGTDDTPEMQSAAAWFASNYGSQLLELIHAPFGNNIKNGKSVGDGMAFYGAATMGQHRNHVHVAAAEPLGAPGGGAEAASASTSTSSSSSSSTTSSWSSEKVQSRDIDWGKASDLWKMASKDLPERKEVTIMSRRDSADATTALAAADGAGGEIGDTGGWGHDYFVSEIARNAHDHNLPAEGAMIGVGTALVESGNPLKMWANKSDPESLKYKHDAVGSDYDSSGLFQQRNNGAWGTIADRMNPYRSAGLFFNAMLRKFPNWQDMAPGAVAQGVQVSAFPDRYAKVMGAALDMVRNTSLYDQGGWLQHGANALNLSGKPEPVLTNAEWRIAGGSIAAITGLANPLKKLTSSLDKLVSPLNRMVDERAVSGAQNQLAGVGKTFAGGYFDKSEIVIDAEKALAETRLQIADDAKTAQKAEESLAEARAELAKVEGQSGSLSVAQKRKLEDAERKLAEAKAAPQSKSDKDGAAKAKKIADAERDLARVREDNVAALQKSQDANDKATLEAMERVEKATEALANAQDNAAKSAKTLEAAERAAGAARFQAAGEFSQNFIGAIQSGVSHVQAFVEAIGQVAAVVDQTRQAVSKLRTQTQTATISRVKAMQDLQLAEIDLAKTRAAGAIDLTKVESDTSASRAELVTKFGDTSVAAMSRAMDRYRNVGVFAIERITEAAGSGASYVSNAVVSGVNQAASYEAALNAQRAQNELDVAKAQRVAALASLELLQATQNQAYAAEILQLQTQQLQKQTEVLYGMTANQAKSAANGMSGLQTALGGVGKVLGGLATGAAGFAAGGPLGAIPGALMALGGLKDAIMGGIDVSVNKDNIKKTWDGMDVGHKIGMVLGLGGGAAATAVGAAASVQYGPDAAVAGAQIGDAIAAAALEPIAHEATSRVERINLDYEDRMNALTRKNDEANANFEMLKAELEVGAGNTEARLQADLDIANYLKEMRETQNPQTIKALQDAVAATKEYQGKLDSSNELQLGELKSMNSALKAVSAALNSNRLDPNELGRAVANAVGPLMNRSASGVAYENARI